MSDKPKTATDLLMDILQKPEIDKIARMVVVYEDDTGYVVKMKCNDHIEVIGMLQYGIHVVATDGVKGKQ